jgi:formylglycine-generating enzyme required for sulfatase activity
MNPTNPELRRFINEYFSDEDLETLCFDYFPEVSGDFGSGMSKNRKVIVLIGHCQRRDRLADLYAALERERAKAWKDVFNAQPVETGRRPVSTKETRDPRQIFLSHATADAELAHELAGDLRAEGWAVWIAPESIRPGEKWVEAINRGLETSGVFVVMLTPDAVSSRWVNTETDAAVEMQHEGLIEFIPLEVTPSEPKRLWRQYQFVRFRESYESGLAALLRRLDGEPPSPPVRISTRERTPQPLKPAKDPDRRIHEKTGIELIRIPAGPFLYGSSDQDTMARDNEKPQRTVDLPEFWIGRYPVTNKEYKRFLDANPSHHVPFVDVDWAKPYNWDEQRRTYPADKTDHPVVLVSWDDAKAFCDWAGLALPTEEQWEKTARGTDGRIWPWGDETPTTDHCNFDDNVGDTTPVGKYSPKGDSPYGCADMAGNVWEWTGSWYTKDSTRALRGGSWNDYDLITRAAYRAVLLGQPYWVPGGRTSLRS